METETMEQYLPQIKKILLFSYLNEDELKKILPVTEIIYPKKEEKIISQGQVSPFFYSIIKGCVEVTLQEPDNKTLYICSVNEGEVFGESAIFMTEKRIADVTSTTDSVILKIHRKDIMTFIKENPQSGNKILMLIIYGLLTKLKDSNMDYAFEKQSVVDPDDIDTLIQDFMTE